MRTLYLSICLFPLLLTAQENIVTDRPDLTESATTLQPGQCQIETGTFLEVEEGQTNWTINSSLFRFGVVRNFELRLVNGLSHIRQSSTNKDLGINDLQVGLKYRIVEGPLQIAYVGHVFLPTGSDGFSGNSTAFSNKLALATGLSDRISTGANLGVDVARQFKPTFSYTWAVGFGLTEKMSYFAEVYGSLSDGDSDHFFDMGFTYLLQTRLQIDFSFGSDWCRNHDYNFWSAGVSWRIDP